MSNSESETDAGAVNPLNPAAAPVPAAANPDAEAHKLWIHCNRCCEQFIYKKSTFFLLACHHVSCDKCVRVCAGRTPSDASVYECPICHSNVRGRQVNNGMPNSFKQFFHPAPYNLSNDFIASFQMANQRHFNRFKEKEETKLHKLSKDIDLAKSVCQKHYFNLELMRVERKKLTQRMRQIKIQVANRKKEKHMSATGHHRTQEPKSGSGHEQDAHRTQKVPVSPATPSRIHRRNTKTTSPSSSQKRRKITSFLHQPNHSFNL